MRCPFCDQIGIRVLDSRPTSDGKAIKRRRECEQCNRRFNTIETIEISTLMIVKKDKTREEFSRDKLKRGIVRACEKRPIPIEILDKMVEEIERECRSQFDGEIESTVIGELVMERLSKIDQVAYVRFASVYRQFKDINVFIEELKDLLNR